MNTLRVSVSGEPGSGKLTLLRQLKPILAGSFNVSEIHEFPMSVFVDLEPVLRDPDEEEFKQSVIPDWAERYDPSGTIVPGRQLCTKDGRRMGNAFVIDLVGYIHGDVWSVLTDAGNKINMLESEIRGAFYIGDYISKSYTIPGLRNLQNAD